MIRRMVEYIIHCDAERLGVECWDNNWHALGCCRSMDECVTEAAKEGWVRVSARFWLCPKCAKKHAAKLQEPAQ